MDVYLPIILASVSIGVLFLTLRVDNIILVLGRKDRLYERFKRGTETLGLEINVELILGARLIAAIFFLLIGIAALISANTASFFFIILAIAVYYYPIKWLNNKEAERINDIKREFPLMVSLLRVYSKAGGLYQSLKIVPYALNGELRRQLDILNIELEVYPFKEALDRLAERSKFPPLTNLVSVITLGMNTGADVDDILDGFAKAAYDVRVNEVKRKIKAQPIIMTVVPGVLMFTMLLLFIYPMFSNIIDGLNSF